MGHNEGYSDAVAGMMHDPRPAKAPPKQVKTTTITWHPKEAHVTHHHTHPAHPPEHVKVPIHQPEAGAPGLDQLHDHMEDVKGQMNPGEQECEDGNCE